jgi:hypothetical protein
MESTAIKETFYKAFDISKAEVEKIIKGKSPTRKGWLLSLVSAYSALENEDLIPNSIIDKIRSSLKSEKSLNAAMKHVDWEYDLRQVILTRIIPYHLYLDKDVQIIENLFKHWTDLSYVIKSNNVNQEQKDKLTSKMKPLILSIEKAEVSAFKNLTGILGYSEASKEFIENNKIKIKIYDEFLEESDDAAEQYFDRLVKVKASINKPFPHTFKEIQFDSDTFAEAKRSFTNE